MLKTRWFPNLKSNTSASTAAVAVLDARTRTVSHYLAQVATRPAEDAEDVHQLRVATRRLAAALSIFKGLLPKPERRKLRRSARRLRRASGAARDLDVLRAMLDDHVKNLTATEAAAGCRAVLDERRQAAQRKLGETAAKEAAKFPVRAENAITAMKRRPVRGVGFVPRLASSARKILPKRLDQLLAAADADLNDLDALHQLRIAAKRLRYAMEVFAYCFPPAFRRELYARVEAIQEELGTINDLRTLRDTLRAMSSHAGRVVARPAKALAEDVAEKLDGEIKERRAAFARRWQSERDSLAEQFHRLMTRPHLRIVRPSRAAGPRRK